MCGFGGILNSAITYNEEAIRTIAKAVAFRGPDHTSVSIYNRDFEKSQAGSSAFFFNRLAIIDLDARSNQPFENDEYTLLFNGEIYNYQELKKDLKGKGIVFKTASDTEVLFHALIVYGKDAIQKLNGMFAFFWLNRKTGKFLLARDRVGIKPLYYKHESASCIFASELATVCRLSSEQAKLSLTSLQSYLCLQYIPTPNSAVEDVYKLPPGHYIEGSVQQLENGSIIKPTCYWDAYKQVNSSIKVEHADLETLLVKSIESQLQADVPLGMFISSGVDSSLITALINKHFKGRSYDFFTVAFDENTASDESSDAINYLKGFNNSDLRHHKLVVSPKAIASNLESFYDYFDEPFGDPAALLNWAISAKAREHVTVVLSGDGADELFWGYPRYDEWLGKKNTLYKKIPFPAFAKKISAVFPPSRLKYSALNILEKDPVHIYFNMLRPRLFGFLPPAEKNKQLWFLDGLSEFKGNNDLPAIIDMKTYLPDAMLYKVDRSSMATSLEVRVPYLDNDVINYALSMPLTSKSTMQFQNKAPLKKLLSELAPHYNLNQPKKGFNFPLTHWLRTEWKEIVLDTITKNNLQELGLPAEQLLWVVKQFYEKKVSCTNEVWYLFNLVLWHQKFKRIITK